MQILIIYVTYNQLRVQWQEHESMVVSASFSHPRSLLGDWNMLTQSLSPFLQAWKKSLSKWGIPPLLHMVWVLPPQEGGLLQAELRLIKELSHSVYTGRLYAYACESEPLNYAHWQATIPTLARL